jgi:hypothetical protein
LNQKSLFLSLQFFQQGQQGSYVFGENSHDRIFYKVTRKSSVRRWKIQTDSFIRFELGSLFFKFVKLGSHLPQPQKQHLQRQKQQGKNDAPAPQHDTALLLVHHLAEVGFGVLGSDEVKMEFSTPSRAGILTPVEEENKDREILMLVMPVMLNN